MREAEDVVDEEQHVLALVAEVLGDRQARKRHAHTGARGLVHLAVDEGALRSLGRAVVLLGVDVDMRLDHLVIEIVALARALADAGEHRVAAVRLGDVVDQLHDEHGLADAGAAEQADLAALGIRRQQIDDLDAGDEDLRLRCLIGKRRSRRVDGAMLVRLDGPRLVHRLADHVDDAPERLGTDRHGDGRSGVAHFLAAHETFGRVHGDGAHGVLAQVLRHLEHEARAVVVSFERIEDRRQMIVELHVDDGACDLVDATNVACHLAFLTNLRLVSLHRLGARNDFDELFCDHRLTRAVVLQGELVDHLARVARR